MLRLTAVVPLVVVVIDGLNTDSIQFKICNGFSKITIDAMILKIFASDRKRR